MSSLIRLVPDKPPPPLSIDAAIEGAQGAYTEARTAQRILGARLHLSEMLHRPGSVDKHRLKAEIFEAREQVKRAQAVVDALERARIALESAE